MNPVMQIPFLFTLISWEAFRGTKTDYRYSNLNKGSVLNVKCWWRWCSCEIVLEVSNGFNAQDTGPVFMSVQQSQWAGRLQLPEFQRCKCVTLKGEAEPVQFSHCRNVQCVKSKRQSDWHFQSESPDPLVRRWVVWVKWEGKSALPSADVLRRTLAVTFFWREGVGDFGDMQTQSHGQSSVLQ